MSEKKDQEPRAVISGINCWCRFDEQVDIVDLIGNPRNPNKHPDNQIALLAKIIQGQGWRQPITVSKRSGYIVKGHGRMEAAKLLLVENVPVEYQDYESEAAEYADLMADNRIAELAEADEGMISELLGDDLFSDFDMDLTGFDAFALNELLDDEKDMEDDTYTSKIEPPIYEPSGPKPDISELCNTEKANAFIADINIADIPEEEKLFLINAAKRHTVFDYGKIANYYAQSDAVVQDLMERSALVIIDFDKAIENGYVKLTKRLGAIADREGKLNE